LICVCRSKSHDCKPGSCGSFVICTNRNRLSRSRDGNSGFAGPYIVGKGRHVYTAAVANPTATYIGKHRCGVGIEQIVQIGCDVKIGQRACRCSAYEVLVNPFIYRYRITCRGKGVSYFHRCKGLSCIITVGKEIIAVCIRCPFQYTVYMHSHTLYGDTCSGFNVTGNGPGRSPGTFFSLCKAERDANHK